MLYRRVGRTGDGVGVIGLGLSSNKTAGSRETIRMVSVALDAGVNYIDTAIADVFSFEAVGKALSGRREQAMLQTHFEPITRLVCTEGSTAWMR